MFEISTKNSLRFLWYILLNEDFIL
jgi:hypothetical protein